MACFNADVLFIHIPKTGGTALKAAMWAQWPGMQGRGPGGGGQAPDPSDPFPIGHVPLRDCERLLRRPASDFRKVVAVIRNPYAQQISQWKFWADRYQRGGRHEHDIAAACYPTVHGFLADPRCDFMRWYAERIHPHHMPWNPTNGYAGLAGTYLWWLTDSAGKLPPNLALLRQEELALGFDTLTRELYKRPGELPAVNMGEWKRDNPMAYLVHMDRPRDTLRALDLVEAKHRWAFTHHYVRMDRAQLHAEWARRGVEVPA